MISDRRSVFLPRASAAPLSVHPLRCSGSHAMSEHCGAPSHWGGHAFFLKSSARSPVIHVDKRLADTRKPTLQIAFEHILARSTRLIGRGHVRVQRGGAYCRW